jgi:hypothetical protein
VPNSLVENLDSISARIELPVNGMLRINRSTYSLVVSEVSASDVPPEGYSVNFGGDGSESIQLPRSLFNTEVLSTRISASIITASELFAGRNSSEVVVSNIVSLTLNGRNVSNLNEEIVITIARRRSTTNSTINDTCQFWDFMANGGIGSWSMQGCRVKEARRDSIDCACNHLTSFAIVQVPSMATTTSTPGSAPVNIAPIVVSTIVGVLAIALVMVSVIILAIFLWKQRRGSYSVKQATTGNNNNIMVMQNSPVTVNDYGNVWGQGEGGSNTAPLDTSPL